MRRPRPPHSEGHPASAEWPACGSPLEPLHSSLSFQLAGQDTAQSWFAHIPCKKKETVSVINTVFTNKVCLKCYFEAKWEVEIIKSSQFNGDTSLEVGFEVAVGTLHCLSLACEPNSHLCQEKLNLDVWVGLEWLNQFLVEAGPCWVYRRQQITLGGAEPDELLNIDRFASAI